MKVVIIDDSPEIIEVVSLCFKLRWPSAELFSSDKGQKGLELIENNSPDVVILDIGLPDIDGYEVLKRLRLFSDVPVILLTVRSEEIEKLKGLELGADDYITKPFSHLELLARVRALLRRRNSLHIGEHPEPFTLGDLHIDFLARQVLVHGKEVKLTPTEYSLLCYLTRNAGRVMSHNELLEKVQGHEYADDSENLKVYVQRLRKKIEDDSSSPKFILTERGIGYRFTKPG